jgi:uncharacterized membrane protein YedE/YeeE
MPMLRGLLAAPVVVVGYAVAALFTAVPVYVVVALFTESNSIWPNNSHELKTYGILVAIIAFLTGFPALQRLSAQVEAESTRIAKSQEVEPARPSRIGAFLLLFFLIGGAIFAITFTLWAFHAAGRL